MTHRRDPSDRPADLAAVRRDDELLDMLGDFVRDVRNDSDRELLDVDTALAAMRVDTGRPFVAGVTFLTFATMIGATLGVIMAYLVTGLLSALLWGMALAAISVGLSVGLVAYRERRR